MKYSNEDEEKEQRFNEGQILKRKHEEAAKQLARQNEEITELAATEQRKIREAAERRTAETRKILKRHPIVDYVLGWAPIGIILIVLVSFFALLPRSSEWTKNECERELDTVLSPNKRDLVTDKKFAAKLYTIIKNCEKKLNREQVTALKATVLDLHDSTSTEKRW